MSFEIHTYMRRTRAFVTTLFESDGTTEVTLAAGDVVRFKVGANEETPTLEIGSDAATDGGSTLTYTIGTGDCAITIHAGDLTTAAIAPGTYDAEISVYDASETTIKHVECGVLHVHPSQLGEVGA
jgi:hypothetical protein